MSFFKRAVTAALERREEVRDANTIKFEADVTAGLEKLREAEKNRVKNDLVVRNRKKLIDPLRLAVQEKVGQEVPEALALNAFVASGNDYMKALGTLERYYKNRGRQETTEPTDDGTGMELDAGSTRDFSDMSGDTSKALADMQRQISTTATMTPAQQRARQLAQETENLIRTTDEPRNVGGQVASTIFGTLIGKASPTPVSQAIRERYASFFRTEAEGDEAYNSAMDYLKQIREKGDPTRVPDLPPEMLKDLYREADRELKSTKFNDKLGKEVDNQLKNLRSVALRSTRGVTGNLLQAYGANGTTGDESLDARLRENLARFEEEKRKIMEMATDYYNIGGAMTATKAVSDVLGRRLGGEGSPTYLDQLIANFGRETQPMQRSAGTAKSSTTSTPKSTMSGSMLNTDMADVSNMSEVYASTDTSTPSEIEKLGMLRTGTDNQKYTVVTGNGKTFAIRNEGGNLIVLRLK